MLRLPMTIGLVAILSACSTPKPGTPEAALKILEEKRDIRTEAVDDTVDNIPDWFTQNPKQANHIFSAGTATSPNLQLAIDKGILNAKRMLADSIDGKINSMLKDFITENGREIDPMTLTDVERTTTNILKSINVSGYTIDKLEVQEAGIHYRIFVLLRYPLGKANQMAVTKLQQKVVKTAKKPVEKTPLEKAKDRAAQSYKELKGRTDGGV